MSESGPFGVSSAGGSSAGGSAAGGSAARGPALVGPVVEGPVFAGSSVVGLVMGSDSDWPVMEEAARVLEEFGIGYEADVISAHRMPQEMLDYGLSAVERGLRVIIAGAGGAAHLPGMLASATPLPVIGVPVPLAHLDGMDSLLSIVQMPAGVPVATVSVAGARNAGLLAARILGAGPDDDALAVRSRMVEFQRRLRDEAHAKGERLRARRAHPTGFGMPRD